MAINLSPKMLKIKLYLYNLDGQTETYSVFIPVSLADGLGRDYEIARTQLDCSEFKRKYARYKVADDFQEWESF